METLNPELGRPRFLGYVSNLSETGAFVQCSNPRATGTQFSILIHLPGAPEHGVCCRGEVIWTRSYKGVAGPCPGMGVRFLEVIGQEARRFLARFCGESEPVEFPRHLQRA